MKLKTFALLFLCLEPWCSQAFFPPAERSSSGEVLEYRRRKREEYEREQMNYETQLTASRLRVETALENPPWKSRPNSNLTAPLSSAVSKNVESLKNKNFFMVFFLLPVIGAAVWFLLLKKELFRHF